MLKFYRHFATAYGTIWFSFGMIYLLGDKAISVDISGLLLCLAISFGYAVLATMISSASKKGSADLVNKISELEAKVRRIEFERTGTGNSNSLKPY